MSVTIGHMASFSNELILAVQVGWGMCGIQSRTVAGVAPLASADVPSTDVRLRLHVQREEPFSSETFSSALLSPV